MRRLHFAFIITAAALVLAVPGQTATSATSKLTASVGPSFTISLKDSAGKKVTQLESGVYAISISDRSREHDFRLRGPGLSWRFTTVDFVGKESITLTLRPGTYTFVCDPHARDMRGSFRVT